MTKARATQVAPIPGTCYLVLPPVERIWDFILIKFGPHEEDTVPGEYWFLDTDEQSLCHVSFYGVPTGNTQHPTNQKFESWLDHINRCNEIFELSEEKFKFLRGSYPHE